jgi:hypothetical protein
MASQEYSARAPFQNRAILNRCNLKFMLRWHRTSRGGDFRMMHKGVEYTVAVTAVPSIWRWQFQIGETVKTGKTETKIDLLAIRRVQLRIDRELKKTTYGAAP